MYSRGSKTAKRYFLFKGKYGDMGHMSLKYALPINDVRLYLD